MTFSSPHPSPIDPMAEALRCAQEALFITSPNPRVGCVIVDPHGRILGKGHTQRAGEAHAEIMALADAQSQGHSVRGATVYVTLEPCAHHGRTGPCCDALINAGVAKVIAAVQDPHPLVAGQGFARLRAAGIHVQVDDERSAHAMASHELNLGFFSRIQRQTPWVRLKIAASLDGKTALPDGTSQWITQQAARDDGHAWRARSCAILTGMGTVRHDNPRLDVRGLSTPRQPAVVVVDSQLAIPPSAALFDANRARYLYTAIQDDAAQARQQVLQAQGAVVIPLPNKEGKVNLSTMLGDLAQRGINELHVEAGAELSGALLSAHLVDDLLIYLAPKLLGTGRPMLQMDALTSLSDAMTLEIQSTHMVGADLRVLARVSGRDRF